MSSSDLNVRIDLPGVRLGIVEADGIKVEPSGFDLKREVDLVCARLRNAFSLETLASSPSVVAVREMFRRWGVDASKYRPSSEALLRRVIQGKGLYNVSNVVDLSNLGSIETAWPYGLYDRAKINAPIVLRLGVAEEKYEGIGRRVWHLAGRPVLADHEGPFGSPISDSTRTQVDESVSQVLTVIFAPASASDVTIHMAAKKQAQRLKDYARASEARIGIVSGTRTSMA
jgi:DNA/RNA-binding domain of Phe-tRNA-synthetase-like protein